MKGIQQRINQSLRPGHNQRALWSQDAEYFRKNRAGLLQVFQHSQHNHVIELLALKGYAVGNVAQNHGEPGLDRVELLVIDTYTEANLRPNIGVQEARFKTASDVANA